MHAPDPSENPMPVTDLRTYFRGRWAIDRRIDDRRAGQQHTMRGTGVFQPDGSDPAALLYDEEVVWQPADWPLTATRRYLVAEIAGARAQVRFADGRPFHALDLSTGRCAVAHDCPPDVYDGTYRVLDADRFRVRWTVTGPRKDSVLVTSYSRLA
jgi:hypothetical protein